MKICISSTMNSTNAVADSRFGRCPYFAIYDDDLKTFEFKENTSVTGAHGAGLQASQMIVDEGVGVVITGNVGPNAMKVLQAADIKIFQMEGNKVKDQIEYYNDGKLKSIDTPGSPHAGAGRRNGWNTK